MVRGELLIVARNRFGLRRLNDGPRALGIGLDIQDEISLGHHWVTIAQAPWNCIELEVGMMS